MNCSSCGKDRHIDELSICRYCDDKFCGFGDCRGTCQCDFIATAKIVLLKVKFTTNHTTITKSEETTLSTDTGLLAGPSTYVSG